MAATQHGGLTEPLDTVTSVFGILVLLAIVASVVFSLVGSGSIGGFGHATVCVTQPNTGYSGDGWADRLGVAARPGASIEINGLLQACVAHPGLGQRVLYTLMGLSGLVLWPCLLFLLWRMLRIAKRAGPFASRVASALRTLGWVVIAGTAAAAIVRGLAQNVLLNSLMVAQPWSGQTVAPAGNVMTGLVNAMVPVPVLAGAALLTFARIIRLGAALDDEVKATI